MAAPRALSRPRNFHVLRPLGVASPFYRCG